MTSREFIAAEAGNTDRIILYREGLFWKAYERSAFALCSQVRPLKPTRKVLKSLDGGDLISVGFPSASETATLGDLVVIERSDDLLTLAAPRPIVEQEFVVWKSSVPVKVSKPKPVAVPFAGAPVGTAANVVGAAGVSSIAGSPDHFTSIASSDALSADGSASASVVGSSVPACGGVSHEPVRFGRLALALRRLFAFAAPAESDSAGCCSSETSVERRIVQSLKDFNLADKTPMECMLFISELKNMLIKR